MAEKIVSKPKVAIVGAGFVGSTFAYSLLIHGLVSQIVVIDVNKERAEGEVMDLNHGLPFAYPVKIGVGDYSDCENADIVTIAVDRGQKIEESRLELAQGNFEILKQIVPKIVEYNKDCILLVVSNPLDVMTYAALKLSGFPRNRVVGSGTILDTARLRYLLGEHLQIDPRNIHAYIIGEHGDSEVPVWSLANVAGIRLKDYCPICKIPYDLEYFNDLFLRVRNAGYEILKRKGRTNYAVALGLTKIVESIIRDENAVLTVSCFLQNYHGVSDVCLSVPAILNRNGVEEIIELPLDEKEIREFQESAAIVKKVNSSLGL
ncbi:MAG TPA: L-lactate dehydrogenase [Acidobacteriota bacterium]|nr:L-lactate dehydrogenase [Acidobacteriota bacterium]